MNKFMLEILSPEGISFKGDAYSVRLPTSSGIITVLPGHFNLVTKLDNGEIIIDTGTEKRNITVADGFVEVFDNNVNIVAEFAINSDEENEYKIKQAIKLARDMKKKKKDSVDLSIVETQLKKAIFELKSNVGGKIKKR